MSSLSQGQHLHICRQYSRRYTDTTGALTSSYRPHDEYHLDNIPGLRITPLSSTSSSCLSIRGFHRPTSARRSLPEALHGKKGTFFGASSHTPYPMTPSALHIVAPSDRPLHNCGTTGRREGHLGSRRIPRFAPRCVQNGSSTSSGLKVVTERLQGQASEEAHNGPALSPSLGNVQEDLTSAWVRVVSDGLAIQSPATSQAPSTLAFPDDASTSHFHGAATCSSRHVEQARSNGGALAQGEEAAAAASGGSAAAASAALPFESSPLREEVSQRLFSLLKKSYLVTLAAAVKQVAARQARWSRLSSAFVSLLPNWKFAQELRRLEEEANAHPLDEVKQVAILRELNRRALKSGIESGFIFRCHSAWSAASTSDGGGGPASRPNNASGTPFPSPAKLSPFARKKAANTAAAAAAAVIARVESRKFAGGPRVVVEYLKALVISGRLDAFAAAHALDLQPGHLAGAVAADRDTAATAADASHAPEAVSEAATAEEDPVFVAAVEKALAEGSDHLSVPHLLRELQIQMAGGYPGAEAGSAQPGTAPLPADAVEAPGSSRRRPLHVSIHGPVGLPLLEVATAQHRVGAARRGMDPSGGASRLFIRSPLLSGSGSVADGGGGASFGWMMTHAPAALFESLLVVVRRLVGLAWLLMTLFVVSFGVSVTWFSGGLALRRLAADLNLGNAQEMVGTPQSVNAVGPRDAGAAQQQKRPPGVRQYSKSELPEKDVRSFADVVGCDEAKEELQEVVEFLKDPEKFRRLGAKLPKGVLLTGAPGTGKTLLARAVAGEAGVPFFFRSGSEFDDMYVGVGSRRIRSLFAAAKKVAPCIVFIDEIDSIGCHRSERQESSRKTLNQLLVEMDGFEANQGIIVMAATNVPQVLDPALRRPGRFDRQVTVPLPDARGRREIIDYYLKDKPVAVDVDRELLSRMTQGFSGAEIANLVNEAAIHCSRRQLDTVTAASLDWAFDKVLMGGERKSVKRNDQARRRTAYHEAGHVLVALHVPGASPIHKATIVPRGDTLGMVAQVRGGGEDEFSNSRQQMGARVLVSLGGTVAEEIIFGKEHVTSGATDDLRQANRMATHMVAQCGLSEAVGPVFVSDHAMVSEQMKQRIDSEVRSMVIEAKAKVKALILENVEALHLLANALLERETMTREEIEGLLNPPAADASPSTAPDATAAGTKVAEK